MTKISAKSPYSVQAFIFKIKILKTDSNYIIKILIHITSIFTSCVKGFGEESHNCSGEAAGLGEHLKAHPEGEAAEKWLHLELIHGTTSENRSTEPTASHHTVVFTTPKTLHLHSPPLVKGTLLLEHQHISNECLTFK